MRYDRWTLNESLPRIPGRVIHSGPIIRLVGASRPWSISPRFRRLGFDLVLARPWRPLVWKCRLQQHRTQRHPRVDQAERILYLHNNFLVRRTPTAPPTACRDKRPRQRDSVPVPGRLVRHPRILESRRWSVSARCSVVWLLFMPQKLPSRWRSNQWTTERDAIRQGLRESTLYAYRSQLPRSHHLTRRPYGPAPVTISPSRKPSTYPARCAHG